MTVNLQNINITSSAPIAQNCKFKRVKQMPSIDAKMFFHIHANEFGEDNDALEGSLKSKALEYLHTFLKLRREQNLFTYGLSNETIDEIEAGLRLTQNFAGMAKGSIEEAFDHKRHLLLPGGWKGAPQGHAMYYEIIPDDQSTATVRLFNLGGGSQNHFSAWVGNKVKGVPYLDFGGVSKEALLNPQTLQVMEELLTHAFYPKTTAVKTDYNDADIYEGLKNILNPKSVSLHEGDGEVSPASLKTRQYSGICVWRSLLAFLSTKMTKENYKLFISDIKMQSLLDIKDESQKKSLTKTEWHLFHKSQQKLSRTIVRNFEKTILGSTYVTKAQKKLGEVQTWLEDKKEESLYGPASKINIPTYSWMSYVVNKLKSAPETIPLHKQTLESTQPCTFIYDQIKNTTDWKKVLTVAKEAVASKQHHALHVAFTDFFRKIDCGSVVKTIGNDQQSAKETMLILGQLSKIFFETCVQAAEAHVIYPERLYIMLKLLSLQKSLGMIASPKQAPVLGFDLCQYGIYKDEMRSPSVFFKIGDAEIQKDFKTLVQDLEKGNFLQSCLNYRHDRLVGGVISILLLGGGDRKILQAFPETVQRLIADDPQFAAKETMDQAFIVYTSDKLPDWYKAIRDTYWYLLYLGHDLVVTPPDNRDIDYDFKVQNVKSPPSVAIGIKGITGDFLNYSSDAKTMWHGFQKKFSSLYHPFHSSEMRDLASILSPPRAEKNILSDGGKDIVKPCGMTDELLEEVRLLTTSKTTKIAKTYAFFVKHSSKLADPDFQTLFQLLFFDHGLLQDEMQQAGFASSISEFLHSRLAHYMTNRDISTSVFLLRMIRLFQGFSSNQKNLFDGTLDRLRSILKKEGLEPEEKSTVYAEIASHLARKPNPNDEDIQDILLASMHLAETPVPSKWICPQSVQDARDCLHIHAKAISSYLIKSDNTPNTQVLSALVKMRKGVERNRWKLVESPGCFPSFVSDELPRVAYYPLEGKMSLEDTEIDFPVDIQQHPYFRRLFPGIKKGMLIKQNLYEFIDKYDLGLL